MLDRYAATLDEQERPKFEQVVSRIAFDARGLCVTAALENAFRGTTVDHRRQDFQNRLLEFTQQEDFAVEP